MAAILAGGGFLTSPLLQVQARSRNANSRGHCPFTVKASDSRGQEETSTTAAAPKRGQVSTWFNESYTAWPEIHRVLTERSLASLECRKAYELAQSGDAVLIDVREGQDFDKIHAEGACSAPLFRLIQGNSFKANIRRLGHALITDFAGTERNPEFINQALQAVGGDRGKPVVVICDIGGSLKTVVETQGLKPKSYADPERRFGRASRSLRAAYELQEAGFTNVYHLKGGIQSWIHEELPLVGPGY